MNGVVATFKIRGEKLTKLGMSSRERTGKDAPGKTRNPYAASLANGYRGGKKSSEPHLLLRLGQQ